MNWKELSNTKNVTKVFSTKKNKKNCLFSYIKPNKLESEFQQKMSIKLHLQTHNQNKIK